LIPDRQEDREIAAKAVLPASRQVDGMMPAMIAGADQQEFAKVSER